MHANLEPLSAHKPRIANRYELRGLLGRGGHGDVWQAFDTLHGTLVAVKLLRAETNVEPAQIRREVAALRLLRIPGVVRMFDEGIDAGQPFLVMEYIDGMPFPGKVAERAWETMAMPTFALLETLDRVHAAGVMHRDIKPGNVLVDTGGHPMLLDFGLSLGPSLARESAVEHVIVGTPDYLSPEQLVGETITPASDLYALGVMLYEALAGRLPHEANDFQTLMRQRLTEPCLPLGEVAPDVPRSIADTIDSLLAREAKKRPQSARELIARLRSELIDSGTEQSQFIGDRGIIDKLVQGARAKQSMYLVGKAGTGRTRTLHEVAATLAREGMRTAWTTPGKRAYASLSQAMKLPEDARARKLDRATPIIEGEVAEMLARGDVFLVDDSEQVDSHSKDLLERASAWGAVIRVVDAEMVSSEPERHEAVFLAPWPKEQLQNLFVGPDRIFHLREDAAHELFRRTLGLPALIFRELTQWERAGLVQKVGTRWMVSRDALHYLEAGRVAAPSTPTDAGKREVFPVLTERRKSAHRAIAQSLPRGAEGRLFHLIAGQSEREPSNSGEIVTETLALIEPLVRQGTVGRANAVLLDGLHASRIGFASDAFTSESKLLDWLFELAIADGSPPALDTALYELCRVAVPNEHIGALEKLIRAMLAMRTIAGDRALMLVNDIPPFSNLNLELRRWQVRVHAARRCSLEQEQVVIEEAERWVQGIHNELAHARYSGWLGRLRYRQGRFGEAAELHVKAAKNESWMSERIVALLNAASASLEAFCFDEAAAVAEQAGQLAAQCRQVYGEARAEWLVRTARYRRADGLEVDDEFVELAARTGVLDLEALVCLTEAAIAWRGEHAEHRIRLARRAQQCWTTMGKTWGAAFARTLALTAAEAAEEWNELVASAMHSPVSGAGIQMLGLLGQTCPTRALELISPMQTLRRAIPERYWALRMDVMSVQEAQQIIGDLSI